MLQDVARHSFLTQCRLWHRQVIPSLRLSGRSSDVYVQLPKVVTHFVGSLETPLKLVGHGRCGG